MISTVTCFFLWLFPGITALAAAALDVRLAAARYLFDHGADPNKECNAGSVPLHCAAKNGYLSTFIQIYVDELIS